MNKINLTGDGAAYIRVSTDQQDTERQYAGVRAFTERQGVTIHKGNWFEDEGWARDTADRRPAFNKLMKLATAGTIKWIVVDALDRFGTKSSKQLMHFLYQLEEAGCKLYDAAGKEWTGEDIATIITAVVEGEKSKGEQTEKSHRVLGGMAQAARAGEWLGGAVRLGLDVACFSRAEPAKELWRVVLEGRDKRKKVYPDGRTERFDGKGNFPKHQDQVEMKRLVPTRDQAKLDAARTLFARYSTESITWTALAHWLNGLGFRTADGGYLWGFMVGDMLRDPIYMGFYTWNQSHRGKFHRMKKGRPVEELNYGEKKSTNDEADWIQSARLFEPLIDRATWDAVQKKLRSHNKLSRAPRAARQYLVDLVHCGNCGSRMYGRMARHERPEYICSTYDNAVREKRRSESTCLRNGVLQVELEPFIDRYLAETGKRLEILTDGMDVDHLTGKLEGQQADSWRGFEEGVDRLCNYLATYHPDEYDAILDEQRRQHEQTQEVFESVRQGTAKQANLAAAFKGTNVVEVYNECRKRKAPETPRHFDFVGQLLDSYRSNFDAGAIELDLAKLEAEHTALMDRWADLPTPRAKDKAKQKLAELEAKIDAMEKQKQDAAGVVEKHWKEMHDLQKAIQEARRAMTSESGERANRRRAEALRSVIERIECTFTATGIKAGRQGGQRSSRLASVTIYPLIGDAVEYPASVIQPMNGKPGTMCGIHALRRCRDRAYRPRRTRPL
jgi:DNA invertase Pin-like site-specific DNA recombinase